MHTRTHTRTQTDRQTCFTRASFLCGPYFLFRTCILRSTAFVILTGYEWGGVCVVCVCVAPCTQVFRLDRVVAATVTAWVPGLRHVIGWIGQVSANPRAVDKALGRGETLGVPSIDRPT